MTGPQPIVLPLNYVHHGDEYGIRTHDYQIEGLESLPLDELAINLMYHNHRNKTYR